MNFTIETGYIMLEVFMGFLTVVILFFLIVMLIDGNRFVVREYTLESEKIEKETTIVVLADLHNKKYGRDNERLLKAVDSCKPELVLAAGDILTAKPGKSFAAAAYLMEHLALKYPVYYGLGNHEYRMKIYPQDYGDAYERYTGQLKKAGIMVLDNESVEIEEKNLRLTGVSIERLYYKRFHKSKMEEDYLNNLIGKPCKDSYQILIAHNPEYFEEYADWGADLVLSGHVHGGIMRLPLFGGVVSPKLALFPRYDGGAFYEKNSVMILSRGLGMHTLPVRIFNPGELVSIHLKPCKSK